MLGFSTLPILLVAILQNFVALNAEGEINLNEGSQQSCWWISLEELFKVLFLKLFEWLLFNGSF